MQIVQGSSKEHSTSFEVMPYHVLCCAVQNTLDTRRTGANETMLGAAQEADLAQDTNAASSPGPNQTVWQQYLGGLVMLVRSPSLVLPHCVPFLEASVHLLGVQCLGTPD